MSNGKTELQKTALRVLTETSRTFVIPISFLQDELNDAVTAAYLSMRAIDEIEDHPTLMATEKTFLLRNLESIFLKGFNERLIDESLEPFRSKLPEVTLRLNDWIRLCPNNARTYVLAATAEMAEGMALWVDKDFIVNNEKDLDDYTYYVAGLVGKLLSQLWEWHDGIKTDETLAIGFGRGLQAVNMIRNREEDLVRGADFFPAGWNFNQMFNYAKRNLQLAEQYVIDINKSESILNFCMIPLALAKSTLDAIESGEEKLSRNDVKEIVKKVVGD